MIIVAISSVILVAVATAIHYEVLRILDTILQETKVSARLVLVFVMLATTFAHLIEIAVYALGIYGLVTIAGVGNLAGDLGFSFITCLYFSAETYTTLGVGDLRPTGPLRLIAGVEALNGLLLIGWSASYTYLAMQKFWHPNQAERVLY